MPVFREILVTIGGGGFFLDTFGCGNEVSSSFFIWFLSQISIFFRLWLQKLGETEVRIYLSYFSFSVVQFTVRHKWLIMMRGHLALDRELCMIQYW